MASLPEKVSDPGLYTARVMESDSYRRRSKRTVGSTATRAAKREAHTAGSERAGAEEAGQEAGEQLSGHQLGGPEVSGRGAELVADAWLLDRLSRAAGVGLLRGLTQQWWCVH